MHVSSYTLPTVELCLEARKDDLVLPNARALYRPALMSVTKFDGRPTAYQMLHLLSSVWVGIIASIETAVSICTTSHINASNNIALLLLSSMRFGVQYHTCQRFLSCIPNCQINAMFFEGRRLGEISNLLLQMFYRRSARIAAQNQKRAMGIGKGCDKAQRFSISDYRMGPWNDKYILMDTLQLIFRSRRPGCTKLYFQS